MLVKLTGNSQIILTCLTSLQLNQILLVIISGSSKQQSSLDTTSVLGRPVLSQQKISQTLEVKHELLLKNSF